MNKVLLISLLLIFSTPTFAADSTDLTYGYQFVNKCSIVNSTLTNNQSNYCIGFVYGMSNMMATLSMRDLSTTYITKKFLTYLSQLPKDQLNQRTDLLFLSMIKEYWPL